MRKPRTIPEALTLLLRHATGAPGAHFGDTRERSAYIAGRVKRLSDDVLTYERALVAALADVDLSSVDRGQRAALFDVSHALRAEFTRRRGE